MPVRGGEGGARLGSAAMRDPVAPRKAKPKGPVEAVLLEVSESNTTTPRSSPAKGAVGDVSMPSPQIGDLLQQRVDGTESPENLLLTDAPKSKVSTTNRKVTLAQDSSTEMTVPTPPLRAVSPLEELVAAFVVPSDPVVIVKQEEENISIIPGFTSSLPTSNPAPEVESSPVVEEGTEATAVESPPPPALVLPEEVAVAVPELVEEVIETVVAQSIVEVVEVVPQPVVEEKPAEVEVKKLPAMVALPPSPPHGPIAVSSHPLPPPKPPIKSTTTTASSKLVRAPAKTFRPVSSASNTTSKPPHHPPPPAPRPKPVVSAPSIRVPPPPKPSSIPPPSAASSSSTTKPIHVASVSAAAPPAIKRTIMKMKAGGPPPKVEAEPRKERMRTKAPLPSFKPVSRIPSASGGPGMGTVKKEVGAGGGAKGVVAGSGTAVMVAGKGKVAMGGGAGKGLVRKEAGGAVVGTKKESSTAVESASQPPVASDPAPSTAVVEESPIEKEKKSPAPQPEPATIPLPCSPTQHDVDLAPAPPRPSSISSVVPFPTSTSNSVPPSPAQKLPTSQDLARAVIDKEEREPRPKTTSLVSSNGGAAPTIFDDDGDVTQDTIENDSDEEQGVKFNPMARTLRKGEAKTRAQEDESRASVQEDLIRFDDEDVLKCGSEGGKLVMGKLFVGMGGMMDSPRREFGVEKGNYLL